jgi:gas vesicle structural protein
MAGLTQAASGGRSSGNLIYDVVELILDRGVVIDVFARVALVGIEIITIDARVVVASVDTYLRFAEACGRLDLAGAAKPAGVPELVEGVKGRLTSVPNGISRAIADGVPGLLGTASGGPR